MLTVAYVMVMAYGARRKGSREAFVAWLRPGREGAENLIAFMVGTCFLLEGLALVLLAPFAVWSGSGGGHPFAAKVGFGLAFLAPAGITVLYAIRFTLRRRRYRDHQVPPVEQVLQLCVRAEPVVVLLAAVGGIVAGSRP